MGGVLLVLVGVDANVGVAKLEWLGLFRGFLGGCVWCLASLSFAMWVSVERRIGVLLVLGAVVAELEWIGLFRGSLEGFV